MPRRRRHSLPGGIYHVMMRGNNGQAIFSSDYERIRFCLLIQEGSERYGYRILAFCLMTNHVHLAIQLGDISLSKICQNLAFRYVRFYNKRHNGIGHLFQGRFKSILVNGEIYLKKLIRYIHLNPVRAKLVDDPLEYLWSSHQFYLGHKECKWLSKNLGLQLFGKSYDEAIEQYCCFMAENHEENIDFKNGINFGVVADDEFIETLEVKCVDCDLWMESKEFNLHRLFQVLANWYKVDIEMMYSLGSDHKAGKIRAMIAYLVRHARGITMKEACIVCKRTESAMSQAATRL